MPAAPATAGTAPPARRRWRATPRNAAPCRRASPPSWPPQQLQEDAALELRPRAGGAPFGMAGVEGVLHIARHFEIAAQPPAEARVDRRIGRHGRIGPCADAPQR